MNSREQARFDMLKRVGAFGIANAVDFVTPQPPNPAVLPAQSQAAARFAALNTADTGLLARIAANAATQQGGEGDFHAGTTTKSVLRDALRLEMRGLNRTARAIASHTHNPGLMDQFRMPPRVSDVTLAARARAFGAAAVPLHDEFVDLGHDDTFLADLETHIVAFEEADTDQDEGEEKQAGATAGFGALLEEGLTLVELLDAFVHNFYKSDAVKLGQWKTASHVERQAKKTPTPPTPPTP